MSFANKVVIVTGASSGIGASMAAAFSKEGAHVTIVGRNQEKLNAVKQNCAAVGMEPLVIKADVSKEEEAKRIVEDTVKKYSQIDVLVNNAGVARFGAITDGSIMKTYDELMNINLRAAVHLTTLASPHLMKTKGNIINVSSVGGVNPPRPPLLAYCMSKAALDHFTRGAAIELAAAGIRVNAISPGPVKTDIIENAGFPTDWEKFAEGTLLGRASEPQEIADIALFLASDRARGVTGSNYVSDNGFSLKTQKIF